MASLNLSFEELKAVEQSRQRLSQLSNSINSLKHDVLQSNPLPSLESLQASADILQHNLRYLLDILAQHNDLFNRVAVHPSTNFPGRTQEHILVQLLRKKPEPDVAAAMDEGRETLARLVSSSSSSSSSSSPTANTTTTSRPTTQGNNNNSNSSSKGQAQPEMTAEQQRKQMAELATTWSTARDFCTTRIMQYAEEEDDDPYTEAEREVIGIANVRTGLRKERYDPYAEEDDEEGGGVGGDDVMVVDRPPPPPAPAVVAPEVDGTSLENILRFSTRGEFMPS